MAFRDIFPNQHFVLKIAGLKVEVTSDENAFNLDWEGEKGKFIVHDGVPDVRIRAAWGELSEDGVGDKLFDAGTVWQLFKDNCSYLFRFHSLAFGPRP